MHLGRRPALPGHLLNTTARCSAGSHDPAGANRHDSTRFRAEVHGPAPLGCRELRGRAPLKILAVALVLALASVHAWSNDDMSSEENEFVEEILEFAGKQIEEHINEMVELGVLECGPIGLVVNLHNGNTIGLTLRSVINAARSRLRSARIYRDPPQEVVGILKVVVLIGREKSNSFTHRVWFEKQEGNIVTHTHDWSPTGWEHWILSNHGGSAAFVISSVERSLDYFINEFLRVNEEICLPVRR